jgi:hypothetical protein
VQPGARGRLESGGAVVEAIGDDQAAARAQRGQGGAQPGDPVGEVVVDLGEQDGVVAAGPRPG